METRWWFFKYMSREPEGLRLICCRWFREHMLYLRPASDRGPPLPPGSSRNKELHSSSAGHQLLLDEEDLGASVSDLHSKPNLKLESVLIDYDSFRTKLRNSNPSVTWHRNIKSMWEPNCWTTIPDLVLHVPYRYRRMRGDRRRANRTCDQMLISCLVKFVSCDNRTSLIHQIKDTWNNIKLTMFSDRSEWTKEQRNRSRKTGNSGNSSQENNNNNLQLTEPTFRPLLSLCSEVNLWQMWTPLLKHAEGLQAEADQHGSLNWTWTSATTSCLTDWRGNIKTFTRSNHQIKC